MPKAPLPWPMHACHFSNDLLRSSLPSTQMQLLGWLFPVFSAVLPLGRGAPGREGLLTSSLTAADPIAWLLSEPGRCYCIGSPQSVGFCGSLHVHVIMRIISPGLSPIGFLSARYNSEQDAKIILLCASFSPSSKRVVPHYRRSQISERKVTRRKCAHAC